MSFLNRITALIPFGKKEEILEYYFALNISSERSNCALWTIEKKQLKILETASENYSSIDDLTQTTDKLLDKVLGIRELDPQKILFGVPFSWLSDGNLKEEYLKILRKLVKDLELTPMAYVENSLALVHFLESQEGVPPTAILVGFEKDHLTVTVVRAGKLDGVKIVSRGENIGIDIEKALLTFVGVETLPSKILIYDSYSDNLEKLKSQLLSFSWMSKLSFLHFPKIEILVSETEIKSVCLAGASELDGNVSYAEPTAEQAVKKSAVVNTDEIVGDEVKTKEEEEKPAMEEKEEEDLGFVVGDVATTKKDEKEEDIALDDKGMKEEKAAEENELTIPSETSLVEMEDFEAEMPAQSALPVDKPSQDKLSLKRFLPKGFRNLTFIIGIIGLLLVLFGAYLFLLKAEVKVFVEPKILEKDAQVIADPNQKIVDESAKVIPGQIVETEIASTGKYSATGKKEIGNSAKGTVKIINNTASGQNFSKGTILTTTKGLKFTLDNTASVSATAADADSKSTVTTSATASEIGADGNIPTQTNLTIGNFSQSQFIAKAEGNFSGGTSQQVTVVSSDDQQKLLASLASNLRKQAQQKLQEKLPQKKVLEEALSEEITKKTFNKNVNDQASEFSLNLTAKYKGTAFEDKDLKLIVSKLVTTQVPEGFQLNLQDTETQADVSSLQKDGKLIFLARFKAKLLPKIDTEKIKNQIKGRSASEAVNLIKGMENVLGSEVKISPALPPILQRLPFLGKNIKIEVGLK